MSQVCKTNQADLTAVSLKELLGQEAFQRYQWIGIKIQNLSLSPEEIFASLPKKSAQAIYDFLEKHPHEAFLTKHLQDQIKTLQLLFSQKQSLLEKAAIENPRFSKLQEKTNTLISVIKLEDSDWMGQKIFHLTAQKKASLIALNALHSMASPILFANQRIFRQELPPEVFSIPLALACGRTWGTFSQRLNAGKVADIYTFWGPNGKQYAGKIFHKPTELVSAVKEAFFLAQLSSTIPFIQLLSPRQLIMQYAMQGTFASHCSWMRIAAQYEYKDICTILKPEFFQAILALKELHEKTHWCHRDVKGNNFLFDNNQIKLCDFDLAQRIGEKNHPLQPSSYTAPETGLSTATVTDKMDVWSLGVMMWEMCMGLSLCQTLGYQNTLSLANGYKDEIPLMLLAGWLNLTFGSKDNKALFLLIQKMLSIDPSKRPSLNDVLENEYFSSLYWAPLSPSLLSPAPPHKSQSFPSASSSALSFPSASSSSFSTRTAAEISHPSIATTITASSPSTSIAPSASYLRAETPISSAPKNQPSNEESKDSKS